MKVQKTYTIIVSKNFGRPLSVSLSASSLYWIAGAVTCLLIVLVSLSIASLVVYPRMRALEQQHEKLRQERDTLNNQLHAANQDALTAKDRLLAQRKNNTRQSVSRPQVEFRRDEDSVYLPPIKFSAVSTRVDRNSVELIFRVSREGAAKNNRGGFLFAIFENRDRVPANFLATPRVELNEDGFPQMYKSGIRVTRVRSDITIRRKVRRRSADEYFTHVTLYLFSIRGGLIIRDTYTLKRELFTQPTPTRQKLT